jgi:hypothetical protein
MGPSKAAELGGTPVLAIYSLAIYHCLEMCINIKPFFPWLQSTEKEEIFSRRGKHRGMFG